MNNNSNNFFTVYLSSKVAMFSLSPKKGHLPSKEADNVWYVRKLADKLFSFFRYGMLYIGYLSKQPRYRNDFSIIDLNSV